MQGFERTRRLISDLCVPGVGWCLINIMQAERGADLRISSGGGGVAAGTATGGTAGAAAGDAGNTLSVLSDALRRWAARKLMEEHAETRGSLAETRGNAPARGATPQGQAVKAVDVQVVDLTAGSDSSRDGSEAAGDQGRDQATCQVTSTTTDPADPAGVNLPRAPEKRIPARSNGSGTWSSSISICMDCDTAVETKEIWTSHQCNANLSRAGRCDSVIKSTAELTQGQPQVTGGGAAVSNISPRTAGSSQNKPKADKPKALTKTKKAPRTKLSAVGDPKKSLREKLVAKRKLTSSKKQQQGTGTSGQGDLTVGKDGRQPAPPATEAAAADTNVVPLAACPAGSGPGARSADHSHRLHLRCPDCPADKALPHTNRRTLAAHRLTHHPLRARPLPATRCLLCAGIGLPADHAHQEELDAHTFDEHGAEGTVSCPVCFRWLRDGAELRGHLKANHGVELPPPAPPRAVNCRTCSFQCADLQQLHDHEDRVHMRVVAFPRLQVLVALIEDIDIALVRPPPRR